MALSSAAHLLISSPGTTKQSVSLGAVWVAFLTVVIAGPWLLPGYLFGTDWPGPRHFPFPVELTSSAPIEVLLAGTSVVLPGDLVGKAFVFLILFGAGLLAFSAAPTEVFAGKAAAAAVYVVNPFVYGRLHYGQLFLLAAYALLPWVATRIRELAERPGATNAVVAGISLVVVGGFSPHVLLMAFLLVGITFIVRAIVERPRMAYIRRAAKWLGAAAVVTALASSYWLIPLLMGRGYEGRLVASAGQGDLQAYAAVPDPTLGLVPNLLGLYGFWAESTGRFTSMKSFAPIWPAVLAFLLAICVVGLVATIRHRDVRRSPWLAALLIAGLFTLILEMGYSQPMTRGMIAWLDANFIPYRGMRDAGKWAAVIALVYSQLFGVGVESALQWLKNSRLPRERADWAGGLATGLLIALPLYFGNGLLFGAHGEIRPSPYPPGWYSADKVLSSDPHPGKTLFLPWHEYMSYSFVRNENRVIASPAPTFFSVPIVSSANPGIAGISPPGDPEQRAITDLVSAGAHGLWATVLADHGIKYVLVARELDWNAYAYMGTQAGLSEIGDFGSIVLYRDSLVL